MSVPTRKPAVDEDDIRVSTNRDSAAASARMLGIVLVATAVVFVTLSASVLWWLRRDAGAHTVIAVTTLPVEPQRMTANPIRPVGMHAVHAASPDQAQDVVDALRPTGETRGLAAFPPPGTDPIKPGLVVPENFELPEGYVRHYQITDDGKRLDAILMFSPDYTFVDDRGNPVALPKDGIVPPEMAPPGLPLRTLEVPGQPRPKAARPSDESR